MWVFMICVMQLSVQNSAWARVYIGYVLQPTLIIQLVVNIVTISQVKILYIMKWFKWKIKVARYKAALKIAQHKAKIEAKKRRERRKEEQKRRHHEAMIYKDKESKNLRAATTEQSFLSEESAAAKDSQHGFSSESAITEEDAEPLPEELQDFQVNEEARNNPLLRLMQQRVEENKMAEAAKREEARMAVQKKLLRQ